MGFSIEAAVMAPDAYIPLTDTIEIAAQARIKAIIRPGGSICDDEIIVCAKHHGITMVFAGTRHFKH